MPMRPHRGHHASFLLWMAIVSAALLCGLCGCGVTSAHWQQQAVATTATAAATTTSICPGTAGSWASFPTLAQLKRLSRVIIVGTVVRTQAGSNALCDIHTDATIRVERTVYDPQQQILGTTLVVRTAGGQLANGYGLWVEDEARLGAGDQVVLFLYPDNAPVTRYRVVFGELGATHISGGMVQPWSGGGTMPLGAYITQIEHA